jgi:hypothetical protein
MVKALVAATVVVVSTFAAPVPASGLGIALGLTGRIWVGNDFESCAHVSGPAGATIVGTYTAVGTMQGPGTRVGTVRWSQPFAATGSWGVCVPGAYFGATAGEAKFVLHAHSASGEYAEVLQCVVNRGVVTCV